MVYLTETAKRITSITLCANCPQRDECNQAMEKTCHDFQNSVARLERNWEELPIMIDRHPLPPPLFYKDTAEQYEILLEEKRREATEALKDTTKLLQVLELLEIKPPSVEEALIRASSC